MKLHLFKILLLGCVFLLQPDGAAQAQDIAYGNNPAAGQYITLNGVRHYYEVYGEGRPCC